VAAAAASSWARTPRWPPRCPPGGKGGEPRLNYAAPSQTNLDGNSVDMDRERASFVDNALKYESTLRFINFQRQDHARRDEVAQPRLNVTTPEAAFGRLPLEGATLAARQSRFRGVHLHGAVRGLNRSHESMFRIFDVAGSAVSAQSQRLNVVASNLANADTVAGPDGQAYKARQVVFQTVLMGSRDQPEGAAGVRCPRCARTQTPAAACTTPSTPAPTPTVT
jgi:flagellar basal body rod protein FlgB